MFELERCTGDQLFLTFFSAYYVLFLCIFLSKSRKLKLRTYTILSRDIYLYIFKYLVFLFLKSTNSIEIFPNVMSRPCQEPSCQCSAPALAPIKALVQHRRFSTSVLAWVEKKIVFKSSYTLFGQNEFWYICQRLDTRNKLSSVNSSIHAPNVFSLSASSSLSERNTLLRSGTALLQSTRRRETNASTEWLTTAGNTIRRPTRTRVTRPKTRDFPSCKVTITLPDSIYIYSDGRRQTRWPNSIFNDVLAIW